MEVILLEDVKSLGKKGQIVKINDGYARNYVLPKKLGLEATPKNLNDLKLQKARDEKLAAEELQAAKDLAVKVEEKAVTVKMKTGEGGKTFGTISTKEVAAAVKEQLGLEIDKKKMKLDEPIKTLGSHIISVKLHREVTAKLTVRVEESK
jgi:large subunit ribosomal protein L9